MTFHQYPTALQSLAEDARRQERDLIRLWCEAKADALGRSGKTNEAMGILRVIAYLKDRDP